MAYLFIDSFVAQPDGKAVHGGTSLRTKVERALKNLTSDDGKPGKRNEKRVLEFASAPRKLRGERDGLKGGWKTIWRHCTIEFDAAETGASISGLRDASPTATKRIRIGPFFLDERFSARDMEKIILHEFLHAAFIYEREFHHGMTEQVLIYNLGYDPPANPAGVD